MQQERLWTWLSLGFASLAMLTSLFALATDPTYEVKPEETLDQMRGLGVTSTDN